MAVYPKAVFLVWWMVVAPYQNVLERSRTTLVALQTIVIMAEGILNDSPLTHASSDLDDDESLTPVHLLDGHCTTSLLHEVVEEQDLNDPSYGSITDVSHRAQLQAFLLKQLQVR